MIKSGGEKRSFSIFNYSSPPQLSCYQTTALVWYGRGGQRFLVSQQDCAAIMQTTPCDYDLTTPEP